ncbi:MAG: leucine-rich repeat domain-containing protein [Clostridium sp.]|nr:MAG: leucine-rich repeat domain-containing protein [Clostridium sp.]
MIDSHAFGNTKFDSIVLGSSLKTINESVFEYCTNVKYIYYNGTSADWANVTKG